MNWFQEMIRELLEELQRHKRVYVTIAVLIILLLVLHLAGVLSWTATISTIIVLLGLAVILTDH